MNIFLLLKLTGSNPVGNIRKRSTDGTHEDASSPSECDTTHSYCCNPPLYSPSILDVYAELSTVIDVLNNSCTNATLNKDNL